MHLERLPRFCGSDAFLGYIPRMSVSTALHLSMYLLALNLSMYLLKCSVAQNAQVLKGIAKLLGKVMLAFGADIQRKNKSQNNNIIKEMRKFHIGII